MRRAHAAALALVLMILVVTGVVVASRFTSESPAPDADPGRTRTIASSPSPTTATPAPTPEPAACHGLTYAEALAPTTRSDAVGCSQEHTAQTFRVDTLDLAVDGHLLAVDSEAVQDQAAQRCRAAVGEHLRATPRQLRVTMLDVVWFTPTVEEAAEGADWLRCDVVAVSGGQRLVALPASTGGLLAGAGADRYGMCATAAPGEKAFQRVVCSTNHSWRAVSSVDLPGQAYPTGTKAARVMKPRCRDVAAGLAADPLDLRWAEERPTREQWRQGRRYGLCWVPDRGAAG